jgi:hypothetical protein
MLINCNSIINIYAKYSSIFIGYNLFKKLLTAFILALYLDL